MAYMKVGPDAPHITVRAKARVASNPKIISLNIFNAFNPHIPIG